MTNFTDITGLAGVASAMAAAVLLLPGIERLSKSRMVILQGAIFVLSLIPFGEIPLAAYMRGATGDLSITALVLLWCALLKPWGVCTMVDARQRQVLLTMIALVAIALYPLALGIGMFDPYRLGYGEPLFIAALLLIALAAWLLKSSQIVLCIALAVFGWSIGWYESPNLWDYLIDPFAAIYALGVITIQVIKQLVARQRDTFMP